MKEMLFFIVVGFLLFGFAIFYEVNLAELPFSGQYFIYTVDNSGRSKIQITEDDAQGLLSATNVVLGEGYLFDIEKVSIEETLDYFDAEIISSCRIGDLLVKNCFSSRLNEHVIQGEKKVNLQIAITCDCIKIGYPLILDSF